MILALVSPYSEKPKVRYVSDFKQECYILGDFNTDVLAERNVLKNDFENLLNI